MTGADDPPTERAETAAGGPATVGLPATRRRLLAALADGPVSGPRLAERLGVSRAAVWNHVEALREAGLTVESGDDGYAVTDVTGYSGEAIAYGLEAPFAVEYHDRVGSTNDRARALAARGAAASPSSPTNRPPRAVASTASGCRPRAASGSRSCVGRPSRRRTRRRSRWRWPSP